MVLVVEDDPFQQSAMRELLLGLGAGKILAVSGGREAIEALGRWCFDIVLCDIDLPDLNGPELMQELRRLASYGSLGEAPVWVWISAMAEDIIYSHAGIASTVGFRQVCALKKPLTNAAIAPALQIALTRDTRRDEQGGEPDTPDDAELTEALRVKDGFAVVLQPQVNISTGKLVGAEALCRWKHSPVGRIAPDKFIPRLAALGHLEALFFLVLGRCLGVQQHLINCGMSIPIGINVSAQTLCNPGWFERFETEVGSSGVTPKFLIIEVTEDGPIPDMCQLAITLNRLRLRGYGVAIDDFGVGIATPTLLADLPFTQMKLDRSFVSALAENNQRTAICRSQISLARDLELECVAEGVETEKQRDALLDLGCEIGQGYLWSRPKSEAAFLSDVVAGRLNLRRDDSTDR
ncbi:EAL domain-containing response regulator [Cupriavidus basilensis]|uniref:EAL domain-containing response regulator n=1 Tax=Cupriavidus basilensis TaxID=68895 RepID=A0ABT6AQP2_9BURK|nr:EAL domain-containing response regulator [Cupriavidus basilensis]MDF3834774.1 EAL domain-containing response regulator [Cupriavidus basilensis]